LFTKPDATAAKAATANAAGAFLLMGQPAQNLRDLLSLAGMLRRFALEQTHDNHHVLFISTAMVLEARAHGLATRPQAAAMDMERDNALHVPVDRLV
jgi:hypothetical protein